MTRWFKKFWKQEEGIAYLEFAVALPLLAALFMGGVELTRYIIIAQKVEKATTTVSDVVAQSQSIGTSELNRLVEAASQIMLPYEFGDDGYVIVTSVTKNGTSPPQVNWQYTGGGSFVHPSAVGTPGGAAIWVPFTLDDKENVIIAEVYYRYAPIMTTTLLPSATIYKVSTFRPRLGALGALGS